MNKNVISWLFQVVAALIMLQTLYFKFTAHPQSVKLFTQLELEPWGRIGIGVMELIASILILIPRLRIFGALLGLGLMAGAIFFHLTSLGIIFDGDAGLFTLATITFVACGLVLWLNKEQIFNFINLLLKTNIAK
ncbi:MAG: DoxX family protein [Verrucomicrobia bacterium]|nr:DoxX family protein [Cytophagales bacterium]